MVHLFLYTENMKGECIRFNKYLPADQMYLLEDIKNPGEKPRFMWGGHMGGSGENDSWFYKCVVLNNEVYPCTVERDKSAIYEFFDPVMSVVYDRIGEAVRERGG